MPEEEKDQEQVKPKAKAKEKVVVDGGANEEGAKVETMAAPKVDPMEEYVDYFAFKDNERYKDDIFVSVNGETLQIQRGVPVKIKRKFLEVLMNSQEQDTRTANLIDQYTKAYKKKESQLTY